MSRILVVAILALLSIGICECEILAAITWKRDINSKASLAEAYKSEAKALSADVILGTHIKDDKPVAERVPVIFQKNERSDFSLDEFITEAIEHSKKGSKIVQLNFFGLESVPKSVDVLLYKHREIKFPLWFNGDVLQGPGDDGTSAPLDGVKFIGEAKRMVNVALSMGWKTVTKKDSKEVYTAEQIKAMEDILKNSKINTPDYKGVSLNFPINAFYALKSKDALNKFYEDAKKTNPVTFTVMAKKEDAVDPKELETFIKEYGVEHIYMDVPEDLRKQINLSTNGASSLVQFGLLNIITLAVVTIFRS